MPRLGAWAPGSMLALGCVVTLFVDRQQRMPLVAPLATIPSVMAGQRGRDLELSAAEQRVAGMDAYLLRAYGDSTVAFTVYVGYYEHQTQGRTIHSPKNCLPGSGWEALNAGTVAVETPEGPVRVNRYLLQNRAQRALVLYWYQGRGRVAANEYRVKLELLRDAAVRGRSEEALVRIVVPLRPGLTEHEAGKLGERVARELIPSVRRVLPAA
ncbi:MAG TPA: EpsI family protein [Gemmatimonadales bacterium]|nr:EpsI family protein [Gemmatimonadales bacterium]